MNSVDFTSVSSLTDTVTSNASVMFTRTAEVINTSAAEIISGARTGDIFVLEGGADIVTGGLGTDRYEIRLLENDAGGRVTADYVINELGRSQQGAEEDTILIEGARDLETLNSHALKLLVKKLKFTEIDINQFRMDGSAWTTGGSVEIFNQFYSQSAIYQVESKLVLKRMVRRHQTHLQWRLKSTTLLTN